MSNQIEDLYFEKSQNILHRENIEVNEESPRIIVDNTILSFLKEHQRAVVYRMLQIENKIFICNSLEDTIEEINTNVGFLMDDVGYGKSYSVLGIILHDTLFNKNYRERMKETNYYYSVPMGNITKKITKDTGKNLIDTNLIIIPSHVQQQWTNYTKKIIPSDIPYIILTNTRQLNSFMKKSWKDYKFIIMTLSFYKKFIKEKHEKGEDIHQYTINRIFIDEAEIVKRNTELISHRFLWYITANIEHVLPKISNGYHHVSTIPQNYSIYTMDLKNLKNNLIDAGTIVARANTNFVKQSFCLPDIITHIIKCKDPYTVRILTGIVQKHVIDSINGNDIDNAIQKMGIQSKNQDNIINICVEQLETQLLNTENELQFKENTYKYSSHEAKEIDIKNIREKINKIQEQIKCIKERIENTDMCAICYNDFEQKTLLKCCKNCFCLKCINLWMVKNNSCPMCQEVLHTDNIFHITEKDEIQEIRETREKKKKEETFSEEDYKITNLTKLVDKLQKENDKKILIFSEYETKDIYQQSIKLLTEKNIKWSFLKGNMYVIQNIIKHYKDDDLNVLFLNALHLGTGLNLENTTDIIITHKMNSQTENQVIGRAQRYGRSKPLNVWYLYNKNEYTSQ